MAAQARLFYPVRCAAISLGPNLPRQPKPPGHSKLNAVRYPLNAVILQNEPNFQKIKMNLNICSERRYEKNHPSRLCENEPNRTQFSSLAPSRAQISLLQRMILQNKANLQKCETAPNLCLQRTYETATAQNSRKNKANLQK
jgi:hypothetical protein